MNQAKRPTASQPSPDAQHIANRHPERAAEGLERWPPGYFNETYGALADYLLSREPQGQFDIREALDPFAADDTTN